MMMKNRKTTQRKKNREIMCVTWAFVLLFAAMTFYIAHYSVTHKQELINNSYNGRQKMLLAQNQRGSIYSADGDVLARTVTDAEGNDVREYPYGNLFSHVVGYASNGRLGVEAQANYYLINSNAPLSEKAALDIGGKKYPGDDVYTTLNVELQQVASTALGVYDGAIIVTELYPPGSTFKIITALEYMKENPDTYTGYQYQCNGSIKRGEDRIGCYHGSVHGSVGFTRSFAKSCNTSFANIGLSLDKSDFANTLDSLLFNQELPVSFLSGVSRIDVNEETSESDMMQVSIGQGTTSITPLHLNMITCAIANQGILMKPYVVDHVQSSSGSKVKEFSASSYGKLIDPKEAGILKELMADVVEEGTASRLKGLSYTAAGKTGSAEYGTVKGDSHAWFTGFAPVEDPKICVTIIIEGAGAGGDYAVPIAKRLFDAYFEDMVQ